MNIARIKSTVLSLILSASVIFGFAVEASAQSSHAGKVGAKGNVESRFRGNVVDEDNEPLPGVTVTIPGTKTVTSTDADGNFEITSNKSTVTLRFTFVGMKPQEVRAQSNKRVYVRMEPDAQTLKEVVANGIYTRNIESFTGSVSTFTGDELKTISPTNILRSLSALDPSVIMPENKLMGSDPNSLPDLTINGKMNVQALAAEYETDPNQPLFILDGFESSLKEINDLNMDRVEKISILKDASATAIYGSKAANGVIVVETKRPEPGKLQVSYNGTLQIAWADLSDYNLMNAAQKLEYERLSGVYGNLDGAGLPMNENYRQQYFNRLQLVKEGNDNYWLNEPLRTAYTQTHNIYLQGGDSAFRYGAGISYNRTEGVMKGSDRNVFNHNINLTYRVDNFNFTNQTTVNYQSNQNEIVDFSKFAEMNPFYNKWADNGEVPKYVYKEDAGGGTTYVWNPLWDMQQNSFRKGNTTTISDNFQFEWRIIRSLRVRGSFQYQVQKMSTENFTSPEETSQANLDVLKRGFYNNSNTTSQNYTGRINASYGLVKGVNTFNAVGGMQFAQKSSQVYSFGAQGYTNDLFWNPNFSQGYPQNGKPSSKDTKSRNVSYYANLNYAYHMRYLADFNVSRSGASQFGIDNPFTTTWSAGIGWNIHNENWLLDNNTINYLKLKASYGNPGNQNYDAKLAASIYKYIDGYSNPFGVANIIEQWGNMGLKWQKTKTYNVGLTATLFNNKFNFNVDYQIRKTDPQLVRIDMPASTGVLTTPMNVGGTDNRSISASATYHIFKSQDLDWYVSANINHNTTKYFGIGRSLEEYNKAGKEEAGSKDIVNNMSKALTRMYDGASISGMYAVRSLGIDPATGNEMFLTKDGYTTYEWSSDNELLVGDTNPDFTGNFQTSFLYKGFSIAASFSGRSGGEITLNTLMDKVENISDERRRYNQDIRALTDRWKQPGDIAKYKRIDDTSTTHVSTRFIKTEHTFECTSINLGYRTTSAKFLRTIGARSLDARVYMNDIFRISNIKEERGLYYPFQRSVTMSLGFSF